MSQAQLANTQIVDNMRRLEWGGAVPAESPAAWGARAIYHLDPVEVKFGKDGKRLKRPRAETRATIELLWDRKSAHGESAPVKSLCEWLDATGTSPAIPRTFVFGLEVAPNRYVGEHVELARDCELGQEGERAIVTACDGKYMTLSFPSKRIEVHTGADYRFLRTVEGG